MRSRKLKLAGKARVLGQLRPCDATQYKVIFDEGFNPCVVPAHIHFSRNKMNTSVPFQSFRPGVVFENTLDRYRATDSHKRYSIDTGLSEILQR